MDEVFGSDNFVASIVTRKTAGQPSELLAGTADYILWFAKDRERIKARKLYLDKIEGVSIERYDQAELADGTRRPMTADEKEDPASLANNPDIKEGMSRDEIDRAIKRHAETEVLYDKPYEDAKGIRVCGPFTVESLSPHRTLSLETKRERSTKGEEVEGTTVTTKVIGPDDFGRLILDNMKRAGVQNTFKGEKMAFETLDPHPGEWIQGAGAYTDKVGKRQRVAVCIGPEHGTVGPELVKEAAKEAVKGVGFDTLLIAGFAFDPHVGEEAKRYGALTVADLHEDRAALGQQFAGNGEPVTDVGQIGVDCRQRQPFMYMST